VEEHTLQPAGRAILLLGQALQDADVARPDDGSDSVSRHFHRLSVEPEDISYLCRPVDRLDPDPALLPRLPAPDHEGHDHGRA